MPITAASIELYRRYGGDRDGLSRSADRNAAISDVDWHIIDELRQRAFIVATGRGSGTFGQELERDLAMHLPDEGARNAFRQLVDADVKASREA